MYCEECGERFERAAILALLVDLGCSVSPGPNFCPETEDNEHVWQKPENDEKEKENENRN